MRPDLERTVRLRLRLLGADMHHIDTHKLCKAVDIACRDNLQATVGRVLAVYKVLTPGDNGTKIDMDILREHGFEIVESPRQAPVVLARREPLRFVADYEEMLRLSHAFSLAGTTSAPQPGWALFDRFSSALHQLDPGTRSGKKLRHDMERHPLWRMETHVPEFRCPAFHRRVWQDEDQEWDYVPCSAEEPGAESYDYVYRTATVYYVRPRLDAEQPRTLLFAQPDGEFRQGPGVGQLAAAWNCVERLPKFILETGARIRVRREPDGFIEAEMRFSRERDGWFLLDGSPIPKSSWNGDNFVIG